MAKPRDPFFDFVDELLAPMGRVEIKRMFGGAGVYQAGVMFALLADGDIYLKVDDTLKGTLINEGSEPFVFHMKNGKSGQMNYFRLPSEASDDPELASEWGRKALDVALKAQAAKPKKRRKPGKSA